MRHALVTGAAGAVGGAIARGLRARHPGATLSLVDVAPAIDELARALGGEPHRWDLAAVGDLARHYDALTAARGPVDLLVNAAGIMDVRRFAGFGFEAGARLLAIDLEAPLLLMSRAVPGMIERRTGAIVNVSSMAGITPLRGCTFYGAAKAGLAMASEIARLELADANVKVLTVYPGPVRSELERRARAQLPETALTRLLPTGDADALASEIFAALDRGRPRVVYPRFYELASRLPAVAGRVTSRWSPSPRA